MMKDLFIKLGVIASAIITFFTLGIFFGKKSQKIEQLEENITDAVKSKKRQANRKDDDIAVIRKRMRKYVRK